MKGAAASFGGINDMTRDTPLLEFSQVRATPIDATPATFMRGERRGESLPSSFPSSSSPLFFVVVLSTYQKKERDGHKRSWL